METAQDPTDQNNDATQSAENEDEEQEFEFRLFSAPAKSTQNAKDKSEKGTDEKETDAKPVASTQKLRIRLHSPTPGSGDSSEGRFVKASRGWDYYFSTPSLQGTGRGELTADEESRIAEKKKQFEDMAVSGQHMLTWAKSLVWVSILGFRFLALAMRSVTNKAYSPVLICPGV